MARTWRGRGLLVLFALVGHSAVAAGGGSGESGPGWVGVVGSFPDGGSVTLSFPAGGPAAAGFDVRAGPVSHGPTWLWGGRSTEVGSLLLGRDVGVTIDPFSTDRSVTYPILAGATQVIMWTAGDVPTWTWRVDGAASIGAVHRGNSAFFWDGSSAGSGHHLHAGIMGRGVSITDATYPFRVSGEFRGFAGSFAEHTVVAPLIPPQDLSEDSIILRFPDGRVEECFCFAVPRWGPGEYVLEWRGHSIYSTGQQPVLLAGVDAPAWLAPVASP